MSEEEYKLIITPQAQQDIREILLYIAGELFSPQAALNLHDEFQKGIESLSIMPHRVKTVDDEPWGSAGVRRTRVKKYYIYFIIDDSVMTVKILAVVYIGRNQEKQMEDRGVESALAGRENNDLEYTSIDDTIQLTGFKTGRTRISPPLG